ncbi:MAG: VCBS repeat-containing protein [Propionicimonas sp.]
MRQRRPIIATVAASLLLAPVLSVVITPPAQAAAPAAKPKPATKASPDYDRDGKADLAVAVGDSDGTENMAIRIYYGSGRVVDITRHDLKVDDYGLGGPLLADDLDGDGYTDLVTASSGRTGAKVHLIPGSATGLQVPATFSFTVSTKANSDVSSLALVTSPVRRLAVAVDGREVQLHRLTAAGRPTGTPVTLQPGKGKLPKLSKNSGFGNLASWGNQLFIGARFAKVNGKADAGAVVAVTLNASGAKSARLITQATKGVGGAVGKEHYFGSRLAARDGYLVVGTPWDKVGKAKQSGSIQLFSLKDGKLKPVKRITQATPGIPGKAERGDFFGASVAIGRSCKGVPVVLVGASNEGIRHDEADGSAWVIPLRKTKGCPAKQLWEGHGLPGKPRQQSIGEITGFLRDRGAVDDDLVIGGGGSMSEGPLGRLYRVSAKTGKTVLNDQAIYGSAAGR